VQLQGCHCLVVWWSQVTVIFTFSGLGKQHHMPTPATTTLVVGLFLRFAGAIIPTPFFFLEEAYVTFPAG
jgi:hypothetical protein